MEAEPRGAALLTSPVRRALVDALNTSHRTGCTAADLAQALDLHVTTVRFHLDQLEAAGLVTSGFERGPSAGRPRKVYRAARGSLSEARQAPAFRELARLLAGNFSAEGHCDATGAGVQWARDRIQLSSEPPADTPGRWLGKVGNLVDALQVWGYTAEIATSDRGRTVAVTLTECPFIDLAQDYPAVVCGVHRGLIDGALEQLGEPEATVSLEPFVVPDVCMAHISTQTSFRSHPHEPLSS